MSQENVERWPAGFRIHAFEAICMLTAFAVTIMLAVPAEFGATDRSTHVVLALQTNEGIVAGACTLSIALLAAFALARRRLLPRPVLLVAAVALSVAALAVADLWADMPEAQQYTPEPYAGPITSCVDDPEHYFEPDLNEHFRDLYPDIGHGCIYLLSTDLVLPALVLLWVLAGLSLAIPFYRNLASGKGSRIAIAGAVFLTAEMFALFASIVVLIQHSE
jgi:hypothetical protein